MTCYWIASIKKSKKKFKNTLRQMKTETLHTTTKEVLREKFIAIQAYLKKPERSQRSNLISHLIGTRKRINETQS